MDRIAFAFVKARWLFPKSTSGSRVLNVPHCSLFFVCCTSIFPIYQIIQSQPTNRKYEGSSCRLVVSMPDFCCANTFGPSRWNQQKYPDKLVLPEGMSNGHFDCGILISRRQVLPSSISNPDFNHQHFFKTSLSSLELILLDPKRPPHH